ncbi:MAG: DUF4040 domain-containing protein [Gammaproteobacteria bacterium]|nr:DUF4040 domain-containing protein [Gammaproteobacteria bacterium]
MEMLVDVFLLGLLVATAVAISSTKDLFASIMLTGLYSLISAAFFVLMDAVDVAFTEAAVGAGISTLLMLSCMKLTGQYEPKPHRHRRLLGLVVVSVTGVLLLFGTLDTPNFGDDHSPIQDHLAPHYLTKSMEEIGIPNVVTSVLASYRGFDTFGETVVILTAGIGVLALLGFSPKRQSDDLDSLVAPMHHQKILRVVSKLLIPPILLFALYVQFHGDFGPGGGFQAGVIFAAAIILYAMIFGVHVARQVFRDGAIRLLAALGVLIYGSVGLLSFLSGKNFLDYSVLSDTPQHGQHWGIMLVEMGVGITVAAVMLIIFFTFSARVDKRERDGDENQRQ